MNYSIASEEDAVTFASWASNRRRTWGLAMAGALVGTGGIVLYLRFVRDLPMSLSISTAAGCLVGVGLARVLTDFGFRESVVIAQDSARRVLLLLGLRLKSEVCQCASVPEVQATRAGLELVGSSFSFGKYLDPKIAAVAAAEINGLLRS